MQIPRPGLTAAFSTFERAGHGIIIGAPGIGKSHLLVDHFSASHLAKRPSFLLALDKHLVRNDLELQAELGLPGDLVNTLSEDSRATVTAPGLLIIDSYDALRSEEGQTYVRGLVRRAQNVLRARWRIIVAVRTFDALRSETLLDLFPAGGGSPPSAFQLPGVKCRHFMVPALTDAEAQEAVISVPGLADLYAQGSGDFRRLLHTPFNIWLAEKLLGGGPAPSTLSSAASEVQLLSLFWRQRVTSGPLGLRRRSLLTDITRAMVASRHLSVRLDRFYRPEADDVWGNLFSSEILAEADTAGQRVSFRHNILFDFAVSVLLIDDEAASAVAFLDADSARPVFLRPSLHYYFTRLWYDDRDAFWAVAWLLLTSTQIHLRLFGRLLPMAVIVRECRSVAHIRPLLAGLETNEPGASDAVLRLLQARRALKPSREVFWLETFEALTNHLDRRFAWDLTVQTHDLLAGDPPPHEVEAAAGRIGRAILAWLWLLRKDQPWADSLGASWATRLVVRTHCTDTPSSQSLLRPILESLGNPTFPLGYLRDLVDGVTVIWQCDPGFVGSIYERTFAHEETSTAITALGTPIMPLTSTRAQDFRMCRHALTRNYPEFLAAAPGDALASGIRAIDAFVNREHVAPYANEDSPIFNGIARHFAFNSRQASYVPDISETWRTSTYQDEELEIADHILAYLEKMAIAGDATAATLILDAFGEHARMAFWWSELLLVGTRHPAFFAQRLFPLAVAEPILAGSATGRQVGEFIAAAFGSWSPNQRASVEDAILTLRREGDDDELWLERRKQRLLSRIAPDLLVTEESRAFRARAGEEGKESTNEPFVPFTVTSGTYGDVEWLRDQGADPEKAPNRDLRDASSPLQAFGTAWLNELPPGPAIDAILPVIDHCRRLLQDVAADPPVIAMVRTRIASAAALVARSIGPGDRGFPLIRAVLLEAARPPLSVDGDDGANEDRDDPAWSPRPETEAAQGLPWLALRQADSETLAAIEALARHPDAIVRYLVIKDAFRFSDSAADRFWRLVDDRIANDRATIVRLALCESLARLLPGHKGRVADAARQLWSLIPTDTSKRTHFRDILVDIVIWLRLYAQDPWATQALDNLTENVARPALLEAATFKIWQRAIPSRIATDRAAFDDALALASRSVAQVCRALRDRDRAHDERDTEQLKHLYGVIDATVSHVYFCMSPEYSRDSGATVESRRQFFAVVAPVLDAILDFGLDRGFVLAPTLHYLMELLNEVVKFDPRRAVLMASRAARAGEGSGYSIDSLAIREVVQLVEKVLADHRAEVQEAETLEALMALLDVFASTGWPEAIQLVWRLDDVFR